MLQRKYRLKKYSAFIATYRLNNAVADKNICVYFGKKRTEDISNVKVGFVVSKKIHKRAVVRNRIKRLIIVVFPAPVGPTIATCIPGSTFTEKFLIIGVFLS